MCLVPDERSRSEYTRTVTLIPGDGIGPLVTGAVEQVMEVMHAPVFFEKFEVRGDMKKMPQEVL